MAVTEDALLVRELFQTGAIAVGTTPVRISATPRTPKRLYLMIYNNGSNTVFLGGDSSVEVGTGFPLKPGRYFNCEFRVGMNAPVEIWAVASEDTDVRVAEMR